MHRQMKPFCLVMRILYSSVYLWSTEKKIIKCQCLYGYGIKNIDMSSRWPAKTIVSIIKIFFLGEWNTVGEKGRTVQALKNVWH